MCGKRVSFGFLLLSPTAQREGDNREERWGDEFPAPSILQHRHPSESLSFSVAFGRGLPLPLFPPACVSTVHQTGWPWTCGDTSLA